jgi:signal transduction histidine kinase
MLLDEERRELSISAALGLPDEVVATTRVEMGQSLASLVVQRKSPILLPEQAENNPVIQASLTRSDAGPAICVPLMLKDRVLGVLNASRPLGGAPFRLDDVDLLSILGGQIAVAIENARLFEQAQEEIVERKRAEEELSEHRDHLEELVEERTAELMRAIEQLEWEISERKRVEEQLQQYTVELEEANEELSQYVYVVSHDVRAPLRAVHNYADFLREDLEATLDGDQKAYLDGLNRAVREAEELVGDLLELSRVGQRSALMETVDVGALLQALIASFDLPAEVEILMGDDWPTIDVEPVLLRQIFQNLIDNAVKFNHSPCKCVELGWQPVEDEQYELFVRDNGIGIASRYQEQIFRVFERLHTKEEYEGTGIGLAIVKKAVGRLSGSVRVESKPGEGSTFFVTLPETQEER